MTTPDPIHPASGDLEAAIKRVDRWANYAYNFEDTIAVDSPLSTFTAGDLRLILAALRPADPVIPTEIPAVVGEAVPFQARVLPWLMECFGAEIAADREERCDRFIEEALEQVQSLGWAKERALALVDYVYGRPAGDPHQEAGGVMVTFAALCQAVDLDMAKAGNDELARIMRPEIVAKIRAKQAAKPTGSALPIDTSPPAHDPALIARVREVLIYADLTIRSLPTADQSHVEPIRALLADLDAGAGR